MRVAMRMDVEARVVIELIPPDRVRAGNVEAVVGETLFRLVRAALANEGGVSVAHLRRVVWGETPTAPNTLAVAVSRANKLLLLLGYDKRLAVVNGRVDWY